MAHIPNQAREIYKLAVGMFGAAPGTFYFNEINQGLENGLSLVQYYNLLLNEPSFQTSFGLTPASSNEQFVDAFLDRLLGPGTTNVTQAGRDFAEAQLLARLNANVSRGEVMKIAIDALDAVNQSDPNFAAAAQRLDNAIEVAQTFTEDQNGTSQDVNFLRSRLSLVTSDPASVDAQNQANLATGTNFQLTVNEDSGLAFTGGAGNDLFSAPVINVGGTLTDTLQNIDSLDGGGGTNTLDATLNDGGTTTPALANIQNVALRFAHYGYILENGRVVLDGDAASLRENEDVKEFYLGIGGEGRRSFRDVKHYRRRKRWL